MTIERRQHLTTAEDYERRIKALETRVSELSVSPWFGCLTRNALDVAIRAIDTADLWVCFFDIDRLKQANERWGKLTTSNKIAASIKPRSSDLLAEYHLPIVGQWFSGDEFVAILPEADVLGYAQRVQKALHSEELSATFVLVSCGYMVNTYLTINYADKVASYVKADGHRNLIVRI